MPLYITWLRSYSTAPFRTISYGALFGLFEALDRAPNYAVL